MPGKYCKPNSAGGSGQKTGTKWVAEGVLKAHPATVEYLTLEEWSPGKPRQRSTLTMFIEDGHVKLCLNDRDQARTGWASGATLEAALEALEADLAAGLTEWRPSAPKGRR